MDPKSLWSYQQMQRNLLHQAVALLQPGGTLVYSTCTINPGASRAEDSRRRLAIIRVQHPQDPDKALCLTGENEGNVRYALDTFPLKLVAAEPRIGGAGFGRTNDGAPRPRCVRAAPGRGVVWLTLALSSVWLLHADGTVEHWLSEEERLLVQRFDPVPSESSDTIGFFIAKFQKDLAVQPGTVHEHSQERRR